MTFALTFALCGSMSFATDKIKQGETLHNLRQKAWNEWCKKVQSDTEVSVLPLTPLSEGKRSAWQIPADLEPYATMNFFSGTKGEQPSAGYPVFLYLHGSGPKDIEWSTGFRLAQSFNDAPCAYVIPQIPNELKYYRWWQKSKQWAWSHLFRQLLASPQIDPARLYVFGISEGGYGSQRLASYYGDYFAAAGPMAGGEPLKNAPAENLSNIAFNFRTGEKDYMFYRFFLTQLTNQALDSLENLYPEEFHHKVELVPGMGHHIDYSLTTPWLSRHHRNAQPRHFLWENMEMDSVKRDNFYNLEVLKETDAYRTMYEFTAKDNRVDINVQRVAYQTTWIDPNWEIDMMFHRDFSPAEHGRLRVYLSEQLVDLTKPVTIAVNGKVLYQGNLKISAATMRQSLEIWGDPLRIFPSAVVLEW